MPGSPQTKARRGLWSNLWQTNFAWKRFSYLRLNDADFNVGTCYHLGFYNPEKKQNEICWLILKGVTGVLAGDKDVKFFAVEIGSLRPLEFEFYDHKSSKSELLRHKAMHNPNFCPLI